MFKTEQEEFWAGEFGNDYIGRNISAQLLASNLNFFSKIISNLDPISHIIEFGANVGMNLKALKQLLPDSKLDAIEINQLACEELKKLNLGHVYCDSIIDSNIPNQYDLVLIKGVLIHINPDMLNSVYENMYKASRKYICIAEYYNPSPVTINYRGHTNRLFKRDFCGEMLEKYKDLSLVDYGFSYRRDPVFPQDDITWFVLKKG